MSARKSRHLLMQALVRSSPLFGVRSELNHVDAELAELGRCTKLQPLHRQRLLQVIHASRAIDTLLSAILVTYGQSPKTGIGGKLHQLKALPPATRGYINHATASAFDTAIAHKRNRYAHMAGSFPNSQQEADQFVSEVHACLAMIA
jgi:hypothetical protein